VERGRRGGGGEVIRISQCSNRAAVSMNWDSITGRAKILSFMSIPEVRPTPPPT